MYIYIYTYVLYYMIDIYLLTQTYVASIAAA